uniref:Heparanase n=1 Tax=Periophthalmus magnuspinnatus TaxID=409849 RepID=A0A3B3ZFY0_9GOBI
MKAVIAIVFALVLCPSEELDFIKQTHFLTNSENVGITTDLSRAVQRVDPRFLSLTIDASLASDEKFMNLLGSPKIRALASALTPAFLRFGGTRQDFMVFTPQDVWFSKVPPGRCILFSANLCDNIALPSWLEDKLKKEWVQQQILLKREDLQRKYKRVQFTEATVDQLYSFSNCSGVELIFGLNALLRTADNHWNSSNAQTLMHYCASRQYRMSWELGNEPNSYEKKAGIRINGFQLGEDFVHLRKIMSESRFYQNSGLYGPDVGQPRNHRIDILEGFLHSGSEAIDACTWHHYYVNGRDTSLEDFLDPKVLDTLTLKTEEVLQKVKQASPHKKVWLGETSSAYGGGALGLSDTFVAGFMWLDKLGLGAKLGLNVVMRQVFIGSGRLLVVYDLKLCPLLTYLKSPSFTNGAVTLIAMNLNHKAVRVSVPAHMASSTVVAFVLESDQSGEEGLYSRSVKLNGEVLKMVDDTTLPDLKGVALPPSEHVQLPAYSLSFFVFSDVMAQACLSP